MLIGIMHRPEALSTRNIICASVAVSFLWFSSCISFMAFRPMGVAALSRPSMLADIFMNIDPKAGCPAGMPGNRRVNNGEIRCDSQAVMPARSPIFIMPSQRESTPVRPMDIWNAKAAWSNDAFMISLHIVVSPVAMVVYDAAANAISRNAIQI